MKILLKSAKNTKNTKVRIKFLAALRAELLFIFTVQMK